MRIFLVRLTELIFKKKFLVTEFVAVAPQLHYSESLLVVGKLHLGSLVNLSLHLLDLGSIDGGLLGHKNGRLNEGKGRLTIGRNILVIFVLDKLLVVKHDQLQKPILLSCLRGK